MCMEPFANRLVVILFGILIFSGIPVAVAQPYVHFDKPVYNIGETINVTVFSQRQATVYLFDSMNKIKLTATIPAQTASSQYYTITSRDSAGLWQAYINDGSGSVVASSNALVVIPIVATPTPVTDGTTITFCPSGVCSGIAWTPEDVFVWLRIYMPTLTGVVFIFYIIALFGSYKNIWQQ